MKYSNHQIEALFELCEKFISENEIGCSEKIYQSDHVIANAYEFLEKMCETVGYHESDEE